VVSRLAGWIGAQVWLAAAEEGGVLAEVSLPLEVMISAPAGGAARVGAEPRATTVSNRPPAGAVQADGAGGIAVQAPERSRHPVLDGTLVTGTRSHRAPGTADRWAQTGATATPPVPVDGRAVPAASSSETADNPGAATMSTTTRAAVVAATIRGLDSTRKALPAPARQQPW
jgi:hypothetical protein